MVTFSIVIGHALLLLLNNSCSAFSHTVLPVFTQKLPALIKGNLLSEVKHFLSGHYPEVFHKV